jgi:phage shock protein PspC (stress-responsive transcriptional regulator)
MKRTVLLRSWAGLLPTDFLLLISASDLWSLISDFRSQQGEMGMAFYCHRCGAGLPPTAHFCSSCGEMIPPPPPVETGRPLLRPRIGRHIAGVCAAVARAYGWDVALVRIFCVLTFFFSGGLILIAYLAGWVGIPDEPLALPPEYSSGV